jgi:hypothetical protein
MLKRGEMVERIIFLGFKNDPNEIGFHHVSIMLDASLLNALATKRFPHSKLWTEDPL